MNDDALRARLHELTPKSGEIDPTTIEPGAIIRSGHRRRLSRMVATGMATVIVAAGIAVPVIVTSRMSSTRVSVVSGVPGIPTASELNVDGMPARACGGIAPLSVLTQPGGAENADTPEAASLRNIIAHDPTGGMAPETSHDWVLLAESDGKVTFGQRTGPVGMGAIVTLAEHDGTYTFSQSGGCGPVGYADGSSIQDLEAYSVHGKSLTIRYTGGIYPAGICNSGPPTVHVFQHAETVDVLAVLPPPKPPADGSGCSLVGRTKALTVYLAAPLGHRTLRDIGYVPAVALRSEAAIG